MNVRYEIRPIKHPKATHTFGVWDCRLQVWQTAKETREDAEAWIAEKVIADKNPAPSTLAVRMPLRD